MRAFDVIKKRKGLKQKAKPVLLSEVHPALNQEGTGCDCKGCDSDPD